MVLFNFIDTFKDLTLIFFESLHDLRRHRDFENLKKKKS